MIKIFWTLGLVCLFLFLPQAQSEQWDQIESGKNNDTVNKLYRSADEGYRPKEAIPTPTPVATAEPEITEKEIKARNADEKENIEYMKLLQSHGLSVTTPTMPLEQLMTELKANYPSGVVRTLMNYFPAMTEFMARLFKDKKSALKVFGIEQDGERLKNLGIGVAALFFGLFFLRAWRKDYQTILEKVKSQVLSAILFLVGSLVIFCVLFVDEASIIITLFFRTLLT